MSRFQKMSLVLLRLGLGWLMFYAGITKVLDPSWSAAGYLIFVRLSSVLGAALMMLYYFPVLDFPKIAPHSYIVDDHIIYALALLILAAFRAGRIWGLENWCANLPLCRQYPKLRKIIS